MWRAYDSQTSAKCKVAGMLRLSFIAIALLTAALGQADIIQISTSKFSAHYGYLRHLATQETVPKEFAESIRLLSELEKTFPEKITMRSGKVYEVKEVGRARVNELYWRSVDVIVFTASALDTLRRMPERLNRPVGGALGVKPIVDSVEKALTASAQAYEPVWLEQRLKIKDQQQIWESLYAGRADDMLQSIADRLKFEVLPKKIEIVVLPFTGGKEGMTLQTLEGWKVVVGAQTHEGSAFAEVVLHEATHVMDIVSMDKSYLARLRKALAEAKRSEQEVEQIPHLLIFMSAADAIRQREKSHQPVGERTGAYGRLAKKLLEAAKAGFEKLPDEGGATKAILAAVGG
jgi:hypothetical protein